MFHRQDDYGWVPVRLVFAQGTSMSGVRHRYGGILSSVPGFAKLDLLSRSRCEDYASCKALVIVREM